MQKLSLPITQNTPLKNLNDVANTNKSEENAEKTVSDTTKTSFQAELSRQVQAKQSPDGQVQDKQALPKQTTAKREVSEHVTGVQKAKVKATNVQSNAELSDKPGTELSEQIGLDPKILFAAKVDADATPELIVKKEVESTSENVAINTVDMNSIALISMMAVPQANVPLQANTQGASDKTTDKAATPSITPSITPAITPAMTNADKRLTSVLEAATQKPQSLDTALSSALSQGRNTNVLEKDTTVDTQDGKSVPDQARWQDAILPNTVRQIAGDESATNKLLLNAVKEVAGKEVVIPSGYQPVVQINTFLPMQQAGSTNSITAYPGKSGWDQAISQKVVWMVGAGEQSATLTLNPPDLGPLQVVIHVHNDQADTTFISDNAEVRQALESGLSNLRDKMSESGIQLGQANVNSGGQSQQEFQQATQNRLASQLESNTSASPDEKVTNVSTLARVTNGLVDTFA